MNPQKQLGKTHILNRPLQTDTTMTMVSPRPPRQAPNPQKNSNQKKNMKPKEIEKGAEVNIGSDHDTSNT
jgi:hypothetical protein